MRCVWDGRPGLQRYFHFVCVLQCCEGFSRQLTNDGIIKPGSVGLHAIEEDNYVMSVCGVDNRLRARDGVGRTIDSPILAISGGGQRSYKDDLTGLPLDDDLVRTAIAKEF